MTTNTLNTQVETAIYNNPHLNGSPLTVQHEDGNVVLTGQVRTYFQKQMAQESLRRIDGIKRIDNNLEVHWN